MEQLAINYWAVLVCGILAMVIGFVWYGPLFGKKWIEIVGMNYENEDKRKEMMKESRKLYVTQFILTLFQVWVLAYYIEGWKGASGLVNALWIWSAFVVPTVAGACMWTAEAPKIKWARFLIQAGYQLMVFVVFGFVLQTWK